MVILTIAVWHACVYSWLLCCKTDGTLLMGRVRQCMACFPCCCSSRPVHLPRLVIICSTPVCGGHFAVLCNCGGAPRQAIAQPVAAVAQQCSCSMHCTQAMLRAQKELRCGHGSAGWPDLLLWLIRCPPRQNALFTNQGLACSLLCAVMSGRRSVSGVVCILWLCVSGLHAVVLPARACCIRLAAVFASADYVHHLVC